MSILNVHIRTHTKDKPYQCEYLQKCFSQQSNLTNISGLFRKKERKKERTKERQKERKKERKTERKKKERKIDKVIRHYYVIHLFWDIR